MKKLTLKNWEREFDELLETLEWWQEKDGGWVGDLFYLAEDVKEKIKSFISNLLKSQKQEFIKMLEKRKKPSKEAMRIFGMENDIDKQVVFMGGFQEAIADLKELDLNDKLIENKLYEKTKENN